MQNMHPIYDTQKNVFTDELFFFEHEGKHFVKHSYTREIESPKDFWIDYDKIVFDESSEILIRISTLLGLGEVSLKEDECDIYPPSFHIKVDSSLNANNRINLHNKVMDLLYSTLQKEDKLDYLKKFFVKLDF